MGYMRKIPIIGCLALVLFVMACGGNNSQDKKTGPGAANGADSTMPATVPETKSIIFLGNSLTAGYGLDQAQAYPALLQNKINEAGYQFEVVNAGVSGDTSAGGLRRLDWALEGNVKVLIVAFGGNDGLRGLPVAQMKENLSQIIDKARERSIVIILAGMEAPPNFGQEYATGFRQAFRDVALKKRVLFIPFLLNNVAGKPELNQADGIHPNQQGTQIVADTVWSVLEPLLDQMSGAS